MPSYALLFSKIQNIQDVLSVSFAKVISSIVTLRNGEINAVLLVCHVRVRGCYSTFLVKVHRNEMRKADDGVIRKKKKKKKS